MPAIYPPTALKNEQRAIKAIADMTGESYRVLETEAWTKGVAEAAYVKD